MGRTAVVAVRPVRQASPGDDLGDRGQSRGQVLYPPSDVVANSTNGLKPVFGRVGHIPVLVVSAGDDGTVLPTAKRHDHVGRTHNLPGPRLWVLVADVDPHLGH